MLKKVVSLILAFVFVVNIFTLTLPDSMVAYAFDNFDVEVIKDSAPIREGYYETKDVKKWVKKGTKLTIVGEKRNMWLKLWYKVKGGGYIYSGNVKKVHTHKVELIRYDTNHPHYAIYECKGCKNGGRCGPETTKVKDCEKCYPTSTSSKKENTNKVPNSNATTKADVLVPKQPSFQEEVEKKLPTPVHKHDYKFSNYTEAHPHYAVYKCSCNDSYQDTKKTQKVTGCTTCYPPHSHSYTLTGYGKEHPHAALYECSCKNGYCDYNKTTKVESCKECYPYGYGNDHFCQFVCTDRFLNQHPHYTITECTICGKEDLDRDDENYSSRCDICNSSFKDSIDELPDFHGRIIDLSTGGIIYTPEKITSDELFAFADEIHSTLDVLGLIPAVGEVFDGINVLYYIVEEDAVGAALSGAAMIPFAGIVTTSGKIVRKAGMRRVIDVSTEGAEAIVKTAKKQLAENILSKFSPLGKRILKNMDEYPEYVLKNCMKISRDLPVDKIDDVFYKNQVLLSGTYKGTVTSPAGIKYNPGSNQGHRILHVLERHGSGLNGKNVPHGSLFNADNLELFYLIDEVYSSGNKVASKIAADGRIHYYYDAGRVIGLKGQSMMKMIFEGDEFITAYPVKKVGD